MTVARRTFAASPSCPSPAPRRSTGSTDFVGDMVNEGIGTFEMLDNWIMVGESWFYFVRENEEVRIFPDEDVPKGPRV